MIIKTFYLKKILLFLLLLFFMFSLSFSSTRVLSVSKNKVTKEAINWVDFNITYQALSDTLDADICSYDKEVRLNWVDLLAYLGTIYGGNFDKYKKSDLDKLISDLNKGKNIKDLTGQTSSYDYYKTAYDAVLHGFVGEYEIETDMTDENGRKMTEKKYGLKAFSPIAKGYSFSHYDDFGSSRSYGFRRRHLGHDLMGGVGTPVIAVESGVVESVGWNQYGGWRIGIRSIDKKRYHYYAHLRKDHPYNDIYEGKIIKAGDVIGYLGMTGYSTNENVNNINTPHLHYGIELIFDEEKRKEKYEIWIDVYAITKLLEKNKSDIYKSGDDYYRKYDIFIPEVND